MRNKAFQYTNKLYDKVNLVKRAQSARPITIKGLHYRFEVVDLAKYCDPIKYGVFPWPTKYCTIGNQVPLPRQRQETLAHDIHFDNLLEVLKQTDWAQTLVYKMFCEHGRWIHSDSQIYSEIELKYPISSLSSMATETTKEEFDRIEGEAIIEKHWDKVKLTL